MPQYIGQEIGGYRVMESIGAGGMAKVYKAYQSAFDRFVALKILPETYAEDETYLKRFQQEAKVIARLEHAHILPVFDFGEQNKIAYLAMRYLQAGTLKDLIRRAPGHKLALTDTARIISQIASALDYAHQQGIVHRDVKPANVMVDSRGDAYLTDFGIAKVLEATTQFTKEGAAIGTPTYMSPEQGAGKAVNARSDVYSLGVMLYQMLVGRAPYEADTPLAVMLAHANEPLPIPTQLNPDIPEEIERVILKALAKDPEDRYQSAGEMAAALRDALKVLGQELDELKPSTGLIELSEGLAQGKPSSEVTIDDRQLAKRLTRRKQVQKWIPWVVGLAFVVLLAGGGFAIRNINQRAEALANATIDPDQAAAVVAEITETARAFRFATSTQARANVRLTQTQRAFEEGQLALTPSVTPTATPPPTMAPTPYPTNTPVPAGLGLILDYIDLYDQSSGSQIPLNLSDYEVFKFSWGPEGERILFSGCVKDEMVGEQCIPDLFIYDITNAEVERVTFSPSLHDHWPTWSPTGEWIALSLNGSLTFMSIDGEDQIGYEDMDCTFTPAWAPGGQRVAWLGGTSGCPEQNDPDQVWVMNLDGSERTLLYQSDSPSLEFRTIAWSDDGQSIAFYDYVNDTYYLIDADCEGGPEGCDDSALTVISGIPFEWFDTYYPQWLGVGYLPSAPPPTPLPEVDGGILQEKGTNFQIYSEETGTASLVNLPDYFTYRFSWAPDGERVIFAGCLLSEFSLDQCVPDIFIYSLADGQVERLIHTVEPYESNPVWSPDGQRIAFFRNCGLILADSSGEEVNDFAADGCSQKSAWSPDSQWLAFAVMSDGCCDMQGSDEVWVWDTYSGDGYMIYKSETQAIDDRSIAWSPDGQSVAFFDSGAYYLIDASCESGPEGCDNSALTPIERIPFEWLDTYYPQWEGAAYP